MAEWVIFIAAVLVPSFIIAFGQVLIDMVEEIVCQARSRQSRPVSDDDWNDQNPPKSLNYNYIDWLERDLKVGKYDPDRIALGFDDTEQKPKPLDPEMPAIPDRSGQFSAEESAALVDRLLGDPNELNAKIDAKPVDDSWADADVRDGVYGPETRGLVKRIVDNNGNWSEIRSFGS